MFGDVNPEGGMPSAENLLQLGNTLKGTASFNTEEDSAQDFYSEENGSTPEESVLTEPGLKQVKLNLMEWDNETLKKSFRGYDQNGRCHRRGQDLQCREVRSP